MIFHGQIPVASVYASLSTRYSRLFASFVCTYHLHTYILDILCKIKTRKVLEGDEETMLEELRKVRYRIKLVFAKIKTRSVVQILAKYSSSFFPPPVLWISQKYTKMMYTVQN